MSDVKKVSPHEAQKLIDDEGYEYVDVRTPAEFAAGRPAGSRNIPFLLPGPDGMIPNEAFLSTVAAAFAKSAKIIVGCKAGGRSAKAASALAAAGFVAVADQTAGFDGSRDAFGKVTAPGWAACGLPVTKP